MAPRILHYVNKQLRYYSTSFTSGRNYDAIVVGGGHNGLVAAFYLARAQKRVCVLERRHILGGAAVTEEIIPGYKFSRASYVLGLLRPIVYEDMELKRHGLKVYPRDPSSYTPLHEKNWQSGCARSLILGPHEAQNYQQIAQFSEKDAKAYPQFESQLNRFAEALECLLDCAPPDISRFYSAGFADKIKQLSALRLLAKA
ncbi:hypothetical protein OTU49_014247, partial [Cherax quadricarinatus]